MKKLLFVMSIIAMTATGISARHVTTARRISATVSGTVYNPLSTIVHFNYTSGGKPINLDIAPNSTTEILNMDAQSGLSISTDINNSHASVAPTISAKDAGAQGFIITKDMNITFYTPSK